MKSLHIEQSLPICCSLAALGGILEVGATAVTAIPSVREKEGIPMKWWVQWLAIAGNLVLQAVGSLLSHLIATWFGPVSLVVPFFYSATLLINMLVFSVLGERFTKNMRVGTHVIVIAVILLPVVGPNIQEDQDISILFRNWYSIIWFILLLIACAVTGTLLAFGITKYKMKDRITILLIARATSISVNLTVSRAFILGPSQVVFVIFLVIKIISGAIYTYGIVVQSTAVQQARFVPLNATTIIIVNAITGVIIWEDWRVVESWYGYICVFVLLGLGCDLLLSVPTLLNAENPEFGATKRASFLMNRRRASSGGVSLKHNLTIDTADYAEVDDTTTATTTTGYYDDKKYKDIPTDEDHHHRRPLSRKQAWKSIVSPIHNVQVSQIGTTNASSFDGIQESNNEMHFTRNEVWEQKVVPSRHVRTTIGSTVAIETTALMTEPPKKFGNIQKTVQQIGEKGRQLVEEGVNQPLSRFAAWKDTISPLKSRQQSEKSDGGGGDGDDNSGT